ncbi:class I SAM-dependent methyltransferase [Desulfosediminicola flagellatus]|uniref:class I SAM-dependent methyltransferase n=1 Tax=Desulfosediminicola flagellatus TaxID=2569541 RepID=UPI0010AD9309|nr:class I SAM-dependent methyltransferase [Desulfosediminicola flagellatus]
MNDISLTIREEEQDILFGVINRFIGYFTRQAVPNTINDTSQEYPFVAMDTRQAYEQIRLACSHLRETREKSSEISFIDIGCGIGNILLLAELMECKVSGIEKDSASYDIAKQLVGEECVSQDDIWDFNELGNFDIVYYFRPFSKKELQLTFEKHVENSLKPGAILIANRKMGEDIDHDKRFIRLDSNWPVWVKTTA